MEGTYWTWRSCSRGSRRRIRTMAAQGNLQHCGGSAQIPSLSCWTGRWTTICLSNGVEYNPNPDTIASEFRILESNYSAEYGRRNGGGELISMVTKSGTNGNGTEAPSSNFARNDAFNANSFFNNVNGLPRDVLKREPEYGMRTFGGARLRMIDSSFLWGIKDRDFPPKEQPGRGQCLRPCRVEEVISRAEGTPGNCPNRRPQVVAAFLQANLNFNRMQRYSQPRSRDRLIQRKSTRSPRSTSPPDSSPRARRDWATTEGAQTSATESNELTMKSGFSRDSGRRSFQRYAGRVSQPQVDPLVLHLRTAPGYPGTPTQGP